MTAIYALCDFQTLQKFNISLQKFISICEKYPVVYIQYRDKVNSSVIQKENILTLKRLTSIPIIVNDSLELLEYCDGLHFGQEDLIQLLDRFKLSNKDTLLKLFRKKYSNKIFGLSTHNELEILEANCLDLDYIGLGAYKTTSTKDVENILGDSISYLAKISKHPVGAIGGVSINDNIQNIDYNVIGSGLLKNEN